MKIVGEADALLAQILAEMPTHESVLAKKSFSALAAKLWPFSVTPVRALPLCKKNLQ
jgi:hypothetical protein